MGPYRRDIDGLRALAILPVVLFHADVALFGGGFVGVDVFFVISGFLISGVIARELDRGEFSLAAFYERRARRILPGLCAMMLGTFAASCFVLFPVELQDLGQSLVAAALFCSNILFALESENYFDTGVKPLLHTWSLSVEEQFYLVWPLLLLMAAGARWSRGLLVVGVSAASLVAATWAMRTVPVSAYYLAPFRAWELGLGAWLALGGVRPIADARLRGWPGCC